MPYIAMVCAILADIAMVFTVMVYLAMATHIIARVVWPGVVPKFFSILSHCSSVQFTTPSAAARHSGSAAGELRQSLGAGEARSAMLHRTGAYMPHNNARTRTYVCTVHIIILWYYLRRQDRRVWPL